MKVDFSLIYDITRAKYMREALGTNAFFKLCTPDGRQNLGLGQIRGVQIRKYFPLKENLRT